MIKVSEILYDDQEYEYGFYDDIYLVFLMGWGLIEEVVCVIFKEKNEFEWMFDYWFKVYEIYKVMLMFKFGLDLLELDFDYMFYY